MGLHKKHTKTYTSVCSFQFSSSVGCILLFTYLDLVEGSYFWLSYRVIVLTSPNGKPREFFFLIVCTRLFSKAVLHFRESGLLKHETQHRCKINKIQLLGRSVYPHMQMNLLSTSVLTTCPLILPAGKKIAFQREKKNCLPCKTTRWVLMAASYCRPSVNHRTFFSLTMFNSFESRWVHKSGIFCDFTKHKSEFFCDSSITVIYRKKDYQVSLITLCPVQLGH